MPEFTTSALEWITLVLEERFGYVFTLRQGQSGLKLSLANTSQGYILFPKVEEAFHLSRSDFPCSHWDADRAGWISVLEVPLPAPGVNDLSEPVIEKKEDCFVINYDILGLTYWMLNRIEEIGRTDLDNHNRFPATASHAYKHGYLERPVVDEWLHILGQVIQCTWPALELKRHQFNMKVSHDVDGASRYGFSSFKGMLRGVAGDILKRRNFKSLLLAPLIHLNSSKKIHHADPANTFDWLMNQSEKHNMTSAFYFICGRTDAYRDADYEPEHPAIRELIRRIHNRGHEIGLHPSYNSFQYPEIIKAEANRLRNIMQDEGITQGELGGRMHYLRWEHPTTLQAWNDAGMTYDSTLSYADLPGFRCGTCFEYPAFNPETQKILDIRVRPLIVMDCTVVSDRYLGLGYTQEAEEKILELKNKCRKVHGCFTFLWHNSFFVGKESYYLYEQILSN
ncbi:polysaccharide deacetylase family protein [Psychrobacter sp. KCTC 72983]|uniref:polysaccharide deacetylase family protein n=1 Tax=Psychrobacter sp. KCTC 72983 TaxID=2733866 RepID=UPI001648CDAF|nr:polysaccharide deacetylase family protein [Psychrobacter sp. KCTC 72983]